MLASALTILALAVAPVPTGTSSLDRAVTQRIDSSLVGAGGRSPKSGISVAIVRNGRIVYLKGFGLRDRGTPEQYAEGDDYYGLGERRGHFSPAPADGATVYAIGSVAKQFVAVAVLQMIADGRLRLDDPAARYLPALARLGTITIRELLTQRAGLIEYNSADFIGRFHHRASSANGIAWPTVLQAVAAAGVEFTPGSRFAYSNTDYLALGLIVERVSGKPLGDYLRDRFFEPLGMAHTFYVAPPLGTADVAVGYTDQAGAVVRAHPWDMRWLAGAGGFWSTAGDLARWEIALWAGRVIPADAFAAMIAPDGRNLGPFDAPYGMGFVVDRVAGRTEAWQNGEVGGFHTMLATIPSTRTAVVVLQNLETARPESLAAGILAAIAPEIGWRAYLPQSIVRGLLVSFAFALGGVVAVALAAFRLRRLPGLASVLAPIGFFAGMSGPAIGGYAGGAALALAPSILYVVVVLIRGRSATIDQG
ncbi:MAG: serine hydrolase domain-containing protein [Vulcanimicrobiaceae bacterium]